MVEVQEWSKHFKKMTTNAFQVGGIHWTSWFNDPIYTLQSFKYSKEKVNFTGWEDRNFQDLLDLSDKTVDLKLRNSYLRQAEEILLQQAVVLPVYYTPGWFIKQPHLKLDLSSTNGNIDLSTAQFE